MRYDLLVLGNDPAAHQGAIAAARLGRRVAIVLDDSMESGSRANADVSAMEFVQGALQTLLGKVSQHGTVARSVSLSAHWNSVRSRLQNLVRREQIAACDELHCNGVDMIFGQAHFIGPQKVVVAERDRDTSISADRILIATGSRIARPARIAFDGERILDIDQVLSLERLPESLIILGVDDLASDYALLFASIGVQVTVVCNTSWTDICNTSDKTNAGQRLTNVAGIRLISSHDAIGIERIGDNVAVTLENGERLIARGAIENSARVGNTEHLDVYAAGLDLDERGRLWCNESHQTWIDHIYAAGAVVGFPANSADSKEQGRSAAYHAVQTLMVSERSQAERADSRKSSPITVGQSKRYAVNELLDRSIAEAAEFSEWAFV